MPPNIGNASTTGKQSEIITLFMCQDASMMERKEDNNKQQHSLFSQASWGRLEMKPERNKFKVQAH